MYKKKSESQQDYSEQSVQYKIRKKKKIERWTIDQDSQLLRLYEKHINDWERISIDLPHKTRQKCEKRFWQLKNQNSKKIWTQKQSTQLVKTYAAKKGDWSEIAKVFRTFTQRQCYFEYYKHNNLNQLHKVSKSNNTIKNRTKTGVWTFQQDDLLFNALKKHNFDWNQVQKEFYGIRSTSSCRSRYQIIMAMDKSSRIWSKNEDKILIKQFNLTPYSWARIARKFKNCNTTDCYKRCRKLLYDPNNEIIRQQYKLKQKRKVECLFQDQQYYETNSEMQKQISVQQLQKDDFIKNVEKIVVREMNIQQLQRNLDQIIEIDN